MDMGIEAIGPEQRIPSAWKNYIHEKNMQIKLKNIQSIRIKTSGSSKPIQLWVHDDEYYMTVWLKEPFENQFTNDYNEKCHIMRKRDGEIDIELDEHVTEYILNKILANRV